MSCPTFTPPTMPPPALFTAAFSSLTFYQSFISPRLTGLQADRTVWSTTGGCRHITSSGTVIIWLFYCWMHRWRSAWGKSNIFLVTKFLGEETRQLLATPSAAFQNYLGCWRKGHGCLRMVKLEISCSFKWAPYIPAVNHHVAGGCGGRAGGAHQQTFHLTLCANRH